MVSYFEPKQVPQATQDELGARTGARGIEWNAKKFPWVHLMSMATPAGKYNTLTSANTGPIFGTLYEQGSNQPLPIITSVRVKKQGELGTTRRATISITAFTDQQLSELQRSFFIPGMTVRLQFGWSLSATGQTAPAPYTEVANDPLAICQMGEKANANPAYEGLQGIVSTFSYSLNQDNHWECSLEVMSASQPFLGKTLGNSCCPCVRKEKDQTGQIINKRVAQLKAFFTDIAHKPENIDAYKPTIQGAGNKDTAFTWGMYAYEGEIRNDDGSAPSLVGAFSQITTGEREGFWNKVESVANSAWDAVKEAATATENIFTEGTAETFISFGTLEKAIAAYEFPTTEDKQTPFGILSSKDILIRGHANLESADPRVCIVGGTKYAQRLVQVEKGTLPKAVVGNSVKLQDIMINTVFLAIAFRQTIEQSNDTATLDQFLKYVLDGINQACGNLWQLETVSTTENCAANNQVPTISIIDSVTKFDNDTPPPTYAIPSSPNNSVVRDLKMELRLTDAMKTQALYSNKLDSARSCTTDDSCVGVGLKPLTSPNNVRISDATKKTLTKSEAGCDCETVQDEEKVPVEKDPTLSDVMDELAENVKDSTAESVKTKLIQLYNNPGKEQPKNDKKDCAFISFPFSLIFTVDGVGGFKFGQIITSTRLPDSVRSGYVHQITSVEHELTAQDWTTTVETIAKWKPS